MFVYNKYHDLSAHKSIHNQVINICDMDLIYMQFIRIFWKFPSFLYNSTRPRI